LNSVSPSHASLTLARRLFISVIASCVFVSLTLGGTPAARPAFYVLTLGSMLWFLIRRSTVAAAPSRAAHLLEVVGFNCALTLLLGELSLRAFALCNGHSLVVSNELDAYRLIPGRLYTGGIRGNRLGFPGRDFRADKKSGVLRVAALGDSFAVGPTVSAGDNYLSLLEDALPATEVYNFGVSGTAPREYSLILHKYVWTYRPDLVLVSIFVGNDVTEVMATPRQMDPRQFSLYLFATRSARLLVEEWRRGDDDLIVNETAETENRGQSTLSLQSFREIEARRLTVCQKSPSPNMEKKWRRAEFHLDRIVAECRKRGTALAFVLIPDEFQVNPKVLGDALEDSHLDCEAIDLQAPQHHLVEFFAARDVPCLDLLPEFSKAEGTYTSHDTHWNARGNRLAAKCISDWLKKKVAGSQ